MREDVISHPLGHSSALAMEAPAYSSLRSFSLSERWSLGMSFISIEKVQVTDPSECLTGVKMGGVNKPAMAGTDIRQSSRMRMTPTLKRTLHAYKA